MALFAWKDGLPPWMEKLAVMRANILTDVANAGSATALCTEGERIVGIRRPYKVAKTKLNTLKIIQTLKCKGQ